MNSPRFQQRLDNDAALEAYLTYKRQLAQMLADDEAERQFVEPEPEPQPLWGDPYAAQREANRAYERAQRQERAQLRRQAIEWLERELRPVASEEKAA